MKAPKTDPGKQWDRVLADPKPKKADTRPHDPRTPLTVSLPGSIWEWIDAQPGNRSAVVEKAIRMLMEAA
jgi:hypothetical protein